MATGFPVRRHALVGPVGPLVQADCQGRVSRRAHCQAHEARLEEIAECLVDERVAAFDALPDGRLRVLPGVRDEPLEHALADFLERRRGRRLDLPEAERLDVPLEHVPRERQYYSEELKAELQRRHFEEGETIPELALKTGIPFGT